MTISKSIAAPAKLFLGTLLVPLAILTLCRVIFLLFNHGFFTGIPADQLFDVFCWGLLIDLFNILFINTGIFILVFLSIGLETTNAHRLYKAAFILLIIAYTLVIAFNIFDTGYFRFNKQRSNIELAYIFKDSLGSINSIVRIYWPLIFFFIICVAGLYFSVRKLFNEFYSGDSHEKKRNWYALVVLLIPTIFIASVYEKLALPSIPLLNVEARYLPLAQNSINTFVYSLYIQQTLLPEKHYFPQAEADSITPCIHEIFHGDSINHKNVVICILESFSRSVLDPESKEKAFTPFFDSLIKKSIYFPQAYANGYNSAQGISAILAALPNFIDEPFFSGGYANTTMLCLPQLLKQKGYTTNFFMGASEDHFGFKRLGKLTGIEHFYSRADFNNEKYYDGNWGIFDEPFLQYVGQVHNKLPSPFLSVIFNISSHPPHTLPVEHKKQFTIPGQNEIQNSVSYVDFAFQQFFNKIKTQSWFNNTIFVFTADHWLSPNDRTDYSYVNSSQIPIFIYDPMGTGTVNNSIAEQIDITPTILDLLHYSGKYTGFGRSLADSSQANRYTINKLLGIYQVADDSCVLGYDATAEKIRYFYNYRTDPDFKNSLLSDPSSAAEKQRLETEIRSNIQVFNNHMRIHDLTRKIL